MQTHQSSRPIPICHIADGYPAHPGLTHKREVSAKQTNVALVNVYMWISHKIYSHHLITFHLDVVPLALCVGSGTTREPALHDIKNFWDRDVTGFCEGGEFDIDQRAGRRGLDATRLCYITAMV